MARLLLDENVSPQLVDVLRARGHDAVHVSRVGLSGTPDAVIMVWAARRHRAVVTHDHDFVDNLRALRAGAPSVVRLAQSDEAGVVGVTEQAARLSEVLPHLDGELTRGAVIRVDRAGATSTPLPLSTLVRSPARGVRPTRASPSVTVAAADGPRSRQEPRAETRRDSGRSLGRQVGRSR